MLSGWFSYDGNVGRLHFSCHWPLSIPPGNVRNHVNDGDTNKQTHGQSDQYKL